MAPGHHIDHPAGPTPQTFLPFNAVGLLVLWPFQHKLRACKICADTVLMIPGEGGGSTGEVKGQ